LLLGRRKPNTVGEKRKTTLLLNRRVCLIFESGRKIMARYEFVNNEGTSGLEFEAPDNKAAVAKALARGCWGGLLYRRWLEDVTPKAELISNFNDPEPESDPLMDYADSDEYRENLMNGRR
jgi:hypothetical protein